MRLVFGPLSQKLKAKRIPASAFLTITITEGDKSICNFPWRWNSRQIVLSFESSVYTTLLPWCCNIYWFTSSSILIWIPSSVEVWFSLDCFKFGNREALRKFIRLQNILSLRLSNSWSPCYPKSCIFCFGYYSSLWLQDLPIRIGRKLLHANLFHSTTTTNFFFLLEFLFSLASSNVEYRTSFLFVASFNLSSSSFLLPCVVWHISLSSYLT